MREVVIPTFVYMSEPAPKALQNMAADGVRLVELHGDAPNGHLDLMDAAAVQAVAEAVSSLPLQVWSVHCAFSQPSEEAWDISQSDESRRTVAVTNRIAVVEASGRLRAHHVVVHPGTGSSDRESVSRSRASLARLVEVAREAGVRIAVENLPPDQLGGSLRDMERLLDGLDPAAAGFCLDTGHAMLGGDTVEDYIRALGHRLLAIHWHGNDHSTDGHLFPDVDDGKWDSFFTALDEVGYDLPITLEAAPPSGTSLDTALRSIRAALLGERAAGRA